MSEVRPLPFQARRAAYRTGEPYFHIFPLPQPNSMEKPTDSQPIPLHARSQRNRIDH